MSKVKDKPKVKPFLKWAGGKLRIVHELAKYFPKGLRFVEPFLGAGSVSLNVDYPQYIVNDTNQDLIWVWEYLQEDKEMFVAECKKLFTAHTNKEDAFYKLRQEFNETEDALRKSVLFVYLNRHCYNGLCRYNSDGGFNVPFGQYKEPYFPSDEFDKCSEKISKKFKICCEDFRKVFSKVREGDVVYCDPPYLPMSESAAFDAYAAGGFSLQDHLDLADCSLRAAKGGATVIISNHWNWYSQQIYGKATKIRKIQVSRTISGKTDNRKKVPEVIAIFQGTKS